MMNKSFDEIKSAIKQLFEPFPQVKDVQRRIRHLAQSLPLLDAEADVVLLVGESGVGKTRMLTRTAREFARIEHESFTEIPILYVRIPSNCTYSNLIIAILQALGTGLISGGVDRDRLVQIRTLLRNCKVHVVILDDANQMVDRGRSKSHYALGDLVRQIADETPVNFVLSGVPRLLRMVNLNEQLRSRVTEQIQIEPLAADIKERHSIYLALTAFDGCLANLPRIRITDELTAQRFAVATAGRLRSLRNLLVKAVEIAFRSDKPQLDYPVLERAFRESLFPQAAPNRNPFSTTFDGGALTRPGEPFNADAGDLFND